MEFDITRGTADNKKDVQERQKIATTNTPWIIQYKQNRPLLSVNTNQTHHT